MDKSHFIIASVITMVLVAFGTYLQHPTVPAAPVATATTPAPALGAPATTPFPTLLATITVSEDDLGCPTKAQIERGLRAWPTRWITYYRQGELHSYLPINDPLAEPGMDDCKRLGTVLGAKYLDGHISIPVPAGVQQRDGDFVCLERMEPARTGTCYWVSARSPSQRAGPRPTEPGVMLPPSPDLAKPFKPAPLSRIVNSGAKVDTAYVLACPTIALYNEHAAVAQFRERWGAANRAGCQSFVDRGYADYDRGAMQLYHKHRVAERSADYACVAIYTKPGCYWTAAANLHHIGRGPQLSEDQFAQVRELQAQLQRLDELWDRKTIGKEDHYRLGDQLYRDIVAIVPERE